MNEVLKILDDITFPCVQCGYCCTKGVCSYGFWDVEKKQCGELTADNKCARYDEIVELEKDAPYPMMNSGCTSQLYNDRRDAKLMSDPELGTFPEILRLVFEQSLNEPPDGGEVEIVIPWGE